MNDDGHTSSIRDKILTITVKKGWRPGTKITFPQEGDQGPNNVPGIINSSVKCVWIVNKFPSSMIKMFVFILCEYHYIVLFT